MNDQVKYRATRIERLLEHFDVSPVTVCFQLFFPARQANKFIKYAGLDTGAGDFDSDRQQTVFQENVHTIVHLHDQQIFLTNDGPLHY